MMYQKNKVAEDKGSLESEGGLVQFSVMWLG